MSLSGVIKRFVPFVAAVLLGVFVTSLFVEIRPWGGRHHRQSYRELKAENEQLRRQLAERDLSAPVSDNAISVPGVEVPGLVPPPPVAPVAPHLHQRR